MKTTLLSFLILIVLVVGCKKEPEPLRIACSPDLLPVVAELGREFRNHFGVPVTATAVVPGDLDFPEPFPYDLIFIDDLEIVARFLDNGTIIRTTDVANTLPILVHRRHDNLPVLKLADLAAAIDHAASERPLRLTIASSGATLPQIAETRFKQVGILLDGDEAIIRLLPYLIKEIRSDGTQRLTTADVTLQQLRDDETDFVVFWDFVAAATIMKQDDANDFVTIAWPPESSDTITIPLGMVRNCVNVARCTVFMDFVKSRRGTELLNSCFLHPDDDLVGSQ